jgi:tetratricopeptide (TPR) repeat protein
MESNWQQGVAALQAGRIDEALTLLRAEVHANPGNAEARKYLGAALAQAGRPAEAVEQLRQAAQILPLSAQIHYNLGVAQSMSGDAEGAKASYYMALQLNPQYEQARTALVQMGAPVQPRVQPPIPTPSYPTALTTHGPAPVAPKPEAVQYIMAIVFGGMAAFVGALIWDKFVYYTNIEFGLISVGIGFLVGLAVSIAAGGTRSVILQVIGALLALWGMLLGYALLIFDGARESAASNPQLAGTSNVLLLIYSLLSLPQFFASDPLSLAFVAFGTYEGWKIPGAHTAAPTPQQAPQAFETTTPPASTEPPKPLD